MDSKPTDRISRIRQALRRVLEISGTARGPETAKKDQILLLQRALQGRDQDLLRELASRQVTEEELRHQLGRWYDANS